MTLSEYASGGIVTSFVLYLLAFMAHSLEWATIRGIPLKQDTADGSDEEHDPQRLRSDMFGRLGLMLTGTGALAHAAGVVARGVAAGRTPWGNMYEFVTAALLFAVIAYLFGVWRWGLRWLGIPVTLLLAVGNGLAVTVFYVAIAPLVPALHSVWFIIHIVAACIAAAAFNLGAAASVIYLLKRSAVLRAEKKLAETPGDDLVEPSPEPRPVVKGSGGVALATRTGSRTKADPVLTGFLARVPSLATIDRFAYRAHAFAFPIWTFTIAAGSIWAEYAWGRYWGWDPKETWSLVTWVVYAAYLHARATAGFKGRNAALIALVGIASFWFNFVGVNLLVSGLHSYAGI